MELQSKEGTAKMKRTIGTGLAALMLLALPLAPPASATSGTLFITTDTTLTEDHEGSIVIAADAVTLDCAGHAVTGVGPGSGILIQDRSDVSVRNCKVSGFDNGIVAFAAMRTTIASNATWGNGFAGIWLDTAPETKVRGNATWGNGDNGVGILDSAGILVKGNTATGNLGTAGFAMERVTSGAFRQNVSEENAHAGFNIIEAIASTFEGNEVRANGWSGVVLSDSHGNVLTDSVSSANESTGIELGSSNDNIVRRNVVENNPWAGIRVVSSNRNTFSGNMTRRNGTGLDMHESSENVFTNNRFFNSGPEGWGVWVADSSDSNRFEGNVAQGNDYEGFAIAFGSSGNTLVRNVSRGSNFEGISLYFGADHNVVRDNTVVDNRTSGVLVYESSYNVIIGNRAFRNNLGLFEGSAGISVVQGSSYNEISMNVACANGFADAYDDYSGIGNVWTANKFCASLI